MSLQGECIAQPTDISSLLQFLAPAFFPTLRMVLQLAFTAPITNVSAERSLSCMRRIRTYVRSRALLGPGGPRAGPDIQKR